MSVAGTKHRSLRRAAAATLLCTAAVAVSALPAAADVVPGPPTGVVVTPGFTSDPTGAFSVSFTPPAPNGGSAITSYHVACTSSSGVAGAGDDVASPIVVPGLTTGAKYTCTVRANNNQGAGTPSVAATGTVGAPATPHLLRVLPMQTGAAVTFFPGANNGSAIINYRAVCTSSNGGVPSSPLQNASPVVVQNLTVGATYSCLVSANNLRGAGPTVPTDPFVVGAAGPPTTQCSASSGSLTATPGLVLATAKPQTLTLNVPLGSCSGTWVAAGRIQTSVRSSTPINCRTSLNVTNGGPVNFTWTVPGGMGKSAGSIRLVITSTTGHQTHVHFYGEVNSKANIFTGRHITGNMTLDHGLAPVAGGGDCTVTNPITAFGVTAFSLSLN